MRKYRLSEEQRAFSYQEDGTKGDAANLLI